jgi:vitamin B12 transporter
MTTNQNASEIQKNNFNEKESDTVQMLSEFVVSASRTPQKTDETGRSVTVITSEEIKSSGANSLAELLSLFEGFYITGTQQNFGSNQSLFMRGANNNQSLVLVDGVPIVDPSTPSNALDISELSLADIEQIEIIRGSHSTLYGSSAIGGVINLITRKKMKEGLSADVLATTGTFGKETVLLSQNVSMNYNCRVGFYAGLNFFNTTVNGMDATLDTATIPGLPRDRDGMNRFDYGVKAGVNRQQLNLNFNYRNVEKKTDIDDREFDDDDNYILNFTRKSFSYNSEFRVDSGFVISLNGGFSSMERIAINDSSKIDMVGSFDHVFTKSLYKGTTNTNEIQFYFRQKGYSILLGGGMNEQTMNQEYYSYWSGLVYEGNLDSLNLSSRTNSFFVLTEWNGEIISEKAKPFSLSLGLRSNKNNTFGSSITYHINPSVKVNANSLVYANISTGYNAPSLYQLYSPDKDYVSFISRGNVNLRPETSVTNEFGIVHKMNDNTSLRMSYFQTCVRDVIEYVYLWNGAVPVNSLTPADYRGDTYMNLGTLRSEGIEINARASINKKFTISANCSYLRGKQHNSYESVDTVKSQGHHVQLYSTGGFVSVKDVNVEGLIRRPSTANFSFTYSPFSRLFIRSVVKYVSGRNEVYYDYSLGPFGALGITSLKPYVLVDFISGVNFNRNFSATGRIENLFNTKYSEIRGYSTRGRGIYLTVNYSF